MGIVGGIDGLLSPPAVAQVLDAEPFRLREPVYLPPPGAPTEKDLDEWTEGLRIARRLREKRRASLPVRLRPQTACLDSLDDFGVVQVGAGEGTRGRRREASRMYCPLCGAEVKWSCGASSTTGTAECQDGRTVSRRFPGQGEPCLWRGARVIRVGDDVVPDPADARWAPAASA